MTNSLVPKPFDVRDAKRAREEAARLAERRDGATWQGVGTVAAAVLNETVAREDLATVTEAEAQANRDAIVAEAQARADAFIDVDAKLVAIDEAYDGVITEAGQLGTRLSTAESDITTAQGRLDTAESELTDAFGMLGTVDSRISTAKAASALDAKAKADAAQQAAIDAAALVAQAKANAAESAAKTAAATDAKTKADAAQAAAIAAAKTASDLSASGAKSEAIAAATADAKTKADAAQAAAIAAAALDATAKAAQAKTDAITTAANDATAKANTAKADAIAAASLDATAKAGQAKTDAIASATTMTNGIGKNLSSTAIPTTFNTAPNGSVWRRTDGSGRIIGVWEQTGAGVAGTWTPRLITSETIDNLDVGKLSSSAAVINTLVSQKIAAAAGQYIALDVGQLTVTGSSTMPAAVIAKLWTDVVMSRKVTTEMLAVGAFDNVIPDPNFDGGQWGAMSGVYSITAEGRKGGNTLRIAANTAQSGKYSARIPLAGAASYRITVWVKSNLAIPAGAIGIYTNVKATASSGVSGANQRLRQSSGAAGNDPIAANTWAQLSCVADFTDGFYDFAVGLYTQTSFTTGVALFSEPSVTRMNAGELTVDGTVTARQLETELVLTTRVVAGDPAATHAEMSPLGFKVFASPAGGGAPTEVVRMGVASSDDYFALSKADGSLAATISQDGVISSAQSNVSDALYYKGEELTGILDRLPGGMVAWGKRTTASKNPADTSTRQPFLRVDFPARKGRAYRITTTPIWSSGNGTGAGAYIRLNYRDDGGVVSAFSDMLSGGVAPEQSITNAWEAAPLSLSGMIYPSKDVVASVMISFQGMGTGTVHLNGNVNYPICIFVDDVGPLVSDLGQYLDGNGTSTPPPDPPIKQSYYKEYTLTGASSYQGNGSYYAYNESKMYQGLSPAGAGNLTSIACFQSMTGDLAGATITGMRVYLYFEFWYYNAGGTAYLGLHGHSTPPATFSHSVSGFTASSGWPRPGGRWINIPSAYWAGFKSGAYKGISLQAPGGDYQYYGFASENAIISASYTK